jgi:hypothetical protein
MKDDMRMAFVVSVFVCFLVGAAGYAQLDVVGTINGTIRDQTGAVVPGAEIVITNLNTGDRREAASSDSGTYVLPSVPPGRYSLSVSLTGFKTYVLKEFRLEVKQLSTIDVQLELGGVGEAVTVTAAPPLLDATDSTIGTVIQHAELTEMPLNGRNFTQLLLLAPGASPDQGDQQIGQTVALGEGSVSPAVDGNRPRSNNFRLDGIDNNMRFNNTVATSPPPDALQEVKVSGHDSDAQIAFAAGANVNVTTRAGTNALHGSVWEFLRNNKLSANNFRDNRLGNSGLPYRQNQYGYFLGGPVLIPHLVDGRKSRTYFSTYFEGFKSRRASSSTASVPSQAVRDGDLSELLGARLGSDSLGRTLFQNGIYDPLTTRVCSTCPQGYIRDPFVSNVIPAVRIHPVAQAYMKFIYALPDRTTYPNLVLPQSTRQDSTNLGFRIDHSLRGSDNVYVRMSKYFVRQVTPGALANNPQERLNNGFNAVVTYTHLFSPSFLVDFQMGHNRASVPGHNVPFGDDFQAAVGDNYAHKVLTGWLPTSLSLSGSTFTSASFSSFDLAAPDYAYQYNTDFKKVQGSHNIGFGFRLLHWGHVIGPSGTSSMTFAPQTTGLPGSNNTGESLASFFLGLPTATSVGNYPASHTWGNVYVGYIQDDWKVTRKLTINLGLQYVYASPGVSANPSAAFDYDLALTRPGATDWTYAYLWTAKNPITGAPPNVRRSIQEPDRNDFAPRLGLAYRAFEKTVIRSGFGIAYDNNDCIIQNSGIRLADRAWPYLPSQAITGQNLLMPGPNNPVISLDNPYVPAVLPTIAPLQTITSEGPRLFRRFARDPYVVRWNLAIQRLLPGQMVLDIAYLGSGGRKLSTTIEANTALASPQSVNPRRPLPNTNHGMRMFTHEGSSHYNALQVKLERRFSGGLTFRNSYTWSKSLDYCSDGTGVCVEYPSDWRFSRGPSDFDRTHMNVFSGVYVLPFGRGRRFASQVPAFLDHLIGGWELSSIATYRSGRHYDIKTGRDSANIGTSGGAIVKASVVANPWPAGFQRTFDAWFDKSAFVMPAFGILGNISRNAYRSDPFRRFDFALAKDFRLREGLGLQFRAEFFNAFNQANFGVPVVTLTSVTFGQIASVAAARDIQFALKLHW